MAAINGASGRSRVTQFQNQMLDWFPAYDFVKATDMAVFLPALKIALPYITQVVTAAVPMFTSRPANGKLDEVVPQQIRELQDAVTHNAESVKGLATQWKDTIESIDAAAGRMQKEIVVLRRLVYFSTAIAVVASVLAVIAVAGP